MGLCNNPPILDDSFSKDDGDIVIGIPNKTKRSYNRRFSGQSVSHVRKSRAKRSKSRVKYKHTETLKKCHGILHDLAQCTKRGKNWNHLINNIISNLEAIKFKTVAQEASGQAKELLFAALTKGSQEDKEIGNHFRQLTNMLRGEPWRGGSSAGCHSSLSVPVTKWMLQPKVVESSGFSKKINNDISLTGKKNSDKDPFKEIINFLGKHNSTRLASPTVSFQTFQPPKYIKQFPGLKNILSWNFDLFGFSIETSNRPLSTIFMYMCSQMNIETEIVGINMSKLSSFIQEVESKYGDNPYHNYLHGADVLHSSFNLLQSDFLQQNLSLVHRFALLFASAVHDFRHPGVGNDFLVNTGSKMATTYNDTSVLENWHTSQAFLLLNKPEFNFLENVNGPTKAIIRGSTIQSVLMTDMKRHGEHVKQLQELIEQSWSPSELIDPVKLMSYALHISDLSHPTKRFDIHMEWSSRLTREFLEQGDKELELGMEPGALFDRRKVNMEKGQIGFIDFVILPLWINWTTFIGADEEWINQINLNKEEWQRRAGVESQEKQSQSSSPSETEIDENGGFETPPNEHRSTTGNPQEPKVNGQRDTNNSICQTLLTEKYQDRMYTKRHGNEELRYVRIGEEAVLPSNQRKSRFITSSKHRSVKGIKRSTSQLCSRGQSIDDDGMPILPNLETKRSSNLLRLSDSEYTVGESRDCYIQESQKIVLDPSGKNVQSSKVGCVNNSGANYKFSKLELFSVTPGSSKKLDSTN